MALARKRTETPPPAAFLAAEEAQPAVATLPPATAPAAAPVSGRLAAAAAVPPRPQASYAPRERRGATLSLVARNLVLARQALGVTQEELAASSGVSRATIAQIETGSADFRLSSLLDIAQALGISPALLFVRAGDIDSLGRFVRQAAVDQVLEKLPPAEVDRMEHLRQTGLQRDLFRVVHSAAEAVQTAGFGSAGAAVGAGIGSAEAPGLGTAIGTLLGIALDRGRGPADLVDGGEGI